MKITTPRGAVVVAVDGTRRSAGAVRYAIGEARAREGVLHVVHVSSLPYPDGDLWPAQGHDLEDLIGTGRAITNAAVSQVASVATDLEVVPVHRAGSRVGELVKVAASASVLVLGSETREGIGHLFVGATSLETAARADVPVVIVPADWQGAALGHIVAGVKDVTGSGELLGYAVASAVARHAELRVVHAVEHQGGPGEPGPARGPVDVARATGAGRLRQAVADASGGSVDVELTVDEVAGRPADVLVAAMADADLLVVARHHRKHPHPARLGHVVRVVLGASDIPVVVVPPNGRRDPASSS
ncbi:universal stress protein [Promicromonospora sukumoe]|uniref:Nucleotide-binding universal stress UspA family protein n=1 Tax=Promicromonospora sukumoe TaxID=88382 RepID=A0A7W3J7V3_9MICO|nr:universal stress protein [Promicromonospora sukumoe]MBA8807845.1 nucleotide-binding universal stress UspA family protein [Promicromonospora sukumoe]